LFAEKEQTVHGPEKTGELRVGSASQAVVKARPSGA
jgi:hypothetical protein